MFIGSAFTCAQVGGGGFYLLYPTIGTVGYNIRIGLEARDVPPLTGYEVGISFDPEVLEYTGVIEGGFLSQGWVKTFFTVVLPDDPNGRSGQVAILSVQLGHNFDPAQGSGPLAAIDFRAKKTGQTVVKISRLKGVLGKVDGGVKVVPLAVGPDALITISASSVTPVVPRGKRFTPWGKIKEAR